MLTKESKSENKYQQQLQIHGERESNIIINSSSKQKKQKKRIAKESKNKN